MIGGVLGVVARYQIGSWLSGWSSPPSQFPWATFLINVSGSFVLGFAMRYLTGVASSPAIRLMVTTGFCGGYTTFSTFSYEFVSLMQSGEKTLALSYMLATISLGPLACLGGFALAAVLL